MLLLFSRIFRFTLQHYESHSETLQRFSQPEIVGRYLLKCHYLVTSAVTHWTTHINPYRKIVQLLAAMLHYFVQLQRALSKILFDRLHIHKYVIDHRVFNPIFVV